MQRSTTTGWLCITMPKAEIDELRTQIRRNRLNVEHMEHKEKIKALERAEADAREARIA